MTLRTEPHILRGKAVLPQKNHRGMVRRDVSDDMLERHAVEQLTQFRTTERFDASAAPLAADEDPFSGGMTNVLYLDGHATGRKYMDMILNVSDGDIRTTYGNRNIPNRRPMLAGFYYDNISVD